MSNPGVLAERAIRRCNAFAHAVRNLSGYHKRGMLDFIDLRMGQLDPSDLYTREMLETLKRRVHNDLSLFADQVLGAFEIFVNGGVIPAFGRPEGYETKTVPAAVAARNGRKEAACQPR